MSTNIYIAKQAILDIDDNIFAYELLFRTEDEDGNFTALIDDDLIATSRVLVNALNHLGIENIVGEHKAFINIDKEFLLNDLILTIPKEKFILEILETVIVTQEVIDRVSELKNLGYIFALDDAQTCEEYFENFSALLPLVTYVKLDASLIDYATLNQHISKFNSYDVEILAEKVETIQMVIDYKKIGCTLFQGYYFAKPELIKKEAIDPHYKKIFHLINSLDKDISLDELSEEFESNIDITIQLLRFMNSSALSMKTEIKSIKHAITLLGKQPLKQWLLLIAYSKSNSNNSKSKDNVLLNMAANRAKMMSALMLELKGDATLAHEAAFVGVLSLIDVIIHSHMHTILHELKVNESVNKAIMLHEGIMGSLLELIECVEHFDMDYANKIAKKMKLENITLKKALSEALIAKNF